MNRDADPVPAPAEGDHPPAGDGTAGSQGARSPSAAGAQGRPAHPDQAAPGDWVSLWRDAADGARLEGEPPLEPDEVALLWAGLRAVAADEPAVPAGLVPAVAEALSDGTRDGAAPMVAGEARPALEPVSACPVPPGWRQLARLVWAEARWLPLSFLAVQLLLIAGGLLLHLMAVETASRAALPPIGPGGARWEPGATGAGGPAEPATLAGWQLILLSADSLALVAPWLGTLVALAAAWPRRRQLWADLEALSPFPPAGRLLVRAWVAGGLATGLLVVAGWIQPALVGALFDFGLGIGPADLARPRGGAAVLAPGLARLAPLWLGIAWTLWWQVRAGTLGAMVASAGLWAAVTLGSRFLGPWNPLAAGPVPAAAVQVAMLAVAVGFGWRLWNRPVPVAGGLGD